MTRRALYILTAAAVAAGCADTGSTALEPETLVIPAFSNSEHGNRNFRTHARGREEVPPNDSRAQGQAIFQLSKDGGELHFKLNVANIENVLQAHIHLAPFGVNGGIVAWLYPDAAPPVLIPGRTQGTLSEGVITTEDLVGPLAGATLADLLAAMRAGNTYVNVHTLQFPPGEIRGQIH